MKLKLTHLLAACLMFSPVLTPASFAAGGGAPASSDKSASRITGSPYYVAVTNLNAPIVGARGFDSMMAVDAGLEIHDNQIRAKAEKQMPRLRDGLRRGVRTFLTMNYEYGTVPDLELLSKRLQAAADEIFGPGVAKVTIAAALVHKYN